MSDDSAEATITLLRAEVASLIDAVSDEREETADVREAWAQEIRELRGQWTADVENVRAVTDMQRADAVAFRERAEAAEAKVRRVEALADRLDARFLHEDADAIRRVLAEPTPPAAPHAEGYPDVTNCPQRNLCTMINCGCPYPPGDTEAVYRQADESCGFHRYATRPAPVADPSGTGEQP